MLHKLVISHGALATELVAATLEIERTAKGFSALALPWSTGCEEASVLLREQITRFDLQAEDRLLILSPLFGDTPYRAACGLIEENRVALIGGVNLALLVKLACSALPDLPLEELAGRLRDRARCAIEVGALVAEPPSTVRTGRSTTALGEDA